MPVGFEVYALCVYNVGMSTKRKQQYTIRQVPANVDRVLRARARASGKSFNQVALDALVKGSDEPRVFDDLDFLIGSMSDREAAELEKEIKAQRRIDPKLWK